MYQSLPDFDSSSSRKQKRGVTTPVSENGHMSKLLVLCVVLFMGCAAVAVGRRHVTAQPKLVKFDELSSSSSYTLSSMPSLPNQIPLAAEAEVAASNEKIIGKHGVEKKAGIEPTSEKQVGKHGIEKKQAQIGDPQSQLLTEPATTEGQQVVSSVSFSAPLESSIQSVTMVESVPESPVSISVPLDSAQLQKELESSKDKIAEIAAELQKVSEGLEQVKSAVSASSEDDVTNESIESAQVVSGGKSYTRVDSEAAALINAGARNIQEMVVGFDIGAHLPSYELKEYPNNARVPENGIQYTSNLFSHPKVIEAFEAVKLSWVHDDEEDNPLNQLDQAEKKAYAVKHVKEQCFGSDDENTVSVWIDENLMQQDLINYEGYNVFNLDCRDSDASPLLAFILVLDRYGQVVAVHNPPTRAECVSMYDTDTVLFSLIGDYGIWKWNWKTDETELTPIDGDAHTIQYDHSRNMYWGLRNAAHFDPSVARGWDNDGNVVWEHALEGKSHINFLTVGGDSAYLSLRSAAAIRKVNIKTNKEEKDIGGLLSHVPVVDRKGAVHFAIPDSMRGESSKRMASKGFEWNGPWFRQHMGQHLSDKYFSMFDNHVESDNEHFVNDESSALVVLEYDDEQNFATEVYRFRTGDKSKIYGSANVLPSGNVMGNSYPNMVEPSVPDRQYHVNFWEADIFGNIAWRMSFKGKNPWDPENFVDDYSHSVALDDEPPVGWIVYNTERVYEAPIINNPCVGKSGDANFIQFNPFNTVRTQADMPGSAQLIDATTNVMVSEQVFEFQKSWLPRPITMNVAADQLSKPVTLIVRNSWGDARQIPFSRLDTLQQCDTIQAKRLFV